MPLLIILLKTQPLPSLEGVTPSAIRKEDDLKVDCLDPKVIDFVKKHKIDKLEDLSIKDKGGIYFAKFPLLPFSSTDIRTKMAQKKSIENLVTPEVSDFIKKTASYTSDGHKI